jgi:enoyl-CoA hydratase/carnithine racemase
MSELIQVDKKGKITLLTLNRPEVRNALNNEMCSQLCDALKQHQSVARAFVVSGNGSAFCAGADLKERARMSVDEIRTHNRNIFSTINTISSSAQPVIAAINGPAIAGGLELALACDLRISVPEATFGLVETTLGIIPGAGGTQRLPRLVGPAKAKEMILLGRRIGAEEALKCALVNAVVAPKQLLEEAIHLAKTIAANAPLAVEAAKSLIDKAVDVDLYTGLDLERHFQFQLYTTDDCSEGIKAFQEKRSPRFQGR